jgi:hypothetical protein
MYQPDLTSLLTNSISVYAPHIQPFQAMLSLSPFIGFRSYGKL